MKLQEIRDQQFELNKQINALEAEIEVLQTRWVELDGKKADACLKEFGSHLLSSTWHIICERCGTFANPSR